MPTYKATFIFNHGRYGWSETWYINQSTLDDAKAKSKLLATARSKLLGAPSKLEAVRISDVDMPRICGLVPYTGLAVNEKTADTPWNGWLVSLCAGDLYRRAFILRGLPDDWIKWDLVSGDWVLVPEFVDAHNNWCQSLKTNVWQLRVVLKTGPNAVKITAGLLGNDGSGNLTIAAIGLDAIAGDEIKIAGYTGPDSKVLNRLATVINNNGTVVTVNIPFLDLNDPNNNVGGKLNTRKIGYANITDCKLFRPVKKSTGRAFFVSRGRRSKRLL